MNKKIFRSAFTTAVIVLIASVVLILGILFNFFEKQLKNELKSEAVSLSHAIENEGLSFFDNFEIKDKRITLIAADGQVLADTTADISELDNHSDRKEFIEAIENGTGSSERYSKTLTEKTIYYAVKLNNGNVLRVSTTQYTAVTILISIIQPIIIVLIIALILSLILSSKVSKSIVKPINSLDLDNPASNNTYEELSPLLSKIAAQKRTIKKQLSDAKQKQEEFRLITENMSEGFLVIDDKTNLLTYNSAALKLLGIEEASNDSVLTLNRTKSFRNVIESVLSGQRTESSMYLNDRSYNLIANPVFEGEKAIGAVIIIIDVTESVKRDALRREFTANVSHELKTPLTSISGFAELMTSGGTPDETVIDFSKSIYEEAQRLISLVNDIIKISELDENSGQFEEGTVDLYELSQEIIKRLKMEADKKNVTFHLSGESAKIIGVPKIIDEMIYNLCDNAVKYNKDNGTIDIIISTSDDKVKFTVRDTGIGIPISHQDRIFERFYRVDKSHSKAVGGTGLGLSIVKHGAIYHNADITLDSKEGKGTIISITFPKQHN
ncbi:MAG: ATP-binding protein [Oscillospiraceae bacterium]